MKHEDYTTSLRMYVCEVCGHKAVSGGTISDCEDNHAAILALREGQAVEWWAYLGSDRDGPYHDLRAGVVVKRDAPKCRVLVELPDETRQWVSLQSVREGALRLGRSGVGRRPGC